MSFVTTSSKDLTSHLSNYIAVTVDFTSATWNTVATHEVFTVTGMVRAQIIPECTEDMNAGAGGSIQLGVEGNTNSMVAGTTFSLIDVGELWLSAAAPGGDFAWTAVNDRIINGLDIGYEITVNPFTDGTMIFHCFWEPINSTGNVVAGAGGTL